MREDKKIPLSEVQKRLQAIMQYEKPDIAFDALFRCWMNHPRLRKITRQTFNHRKREDGYEWLKKEEIASFSNYCGVDLT